MENNTKSTPAQRVQKVHSYDASDIKTADSNIKKQKSSSASKSTHKSTTSKPTQQKSNQSQPQQGQTSTSVLSQKVGGWTKFLICITYIMGLFTIMFFLPSWWYFMGFVGLAFSLTIYLLAKKQQTKEASGKVFFVSLCGAIISTLFWVLYLTTRRFGIGFLSTLFRALQIAGAVIATLLVGYYFLEYITGGKTQIKWLNNITEKTQNKLQGQKAGQ